MECPRCLAQIADLDEEHGCSAPELVNVDPPAHRAIQWLSYGTTPEQTKRIMEKAGVTKEDAADLLGKMHKKYPALKEVWAPQPSKRERVLALRERSVRYLEENPDPDPPQTRWRAFWDGFLNAFGTAPMEPVTAEQMMERAVETMNRTAAQATIQVCDEILEELDD